jgi:hypothetical protein
MLRPPLPNLAPVQYSSRLPRPLKAAGFLSRLTEFSKNRGAQSAARRLTVPSYRADVGFCAARGANWRSPERGSMTSMP